MREQLQHAVGDVRLEDVPIAHLFLIEECEFGRNESVSHEIFSRCWSIVGLKY